MKHFTALRAQMFHVKHYNMEFQMEFNEFYAYCQQVFGANDYLPSVDEDKSLKLYKLTEHMLEVNKHMNLTAIKDEKSVILKHYADSLAVSKYIPEGSNIIDVGCGAGFPTLPLAIFRPDLRITALDSTAKRINYVKETAKMLDLSNVTAIESRAEDMASNVDHREKYDVATAIAVASLPILAELCLPFVKPDGQFIAMKSQKTSEEVDASANAIKKCGGELDAVIQLKLSDGAESSEDRTLVIVDKKVRTPKEFPREFSKIKKKPL